MKVADIFKAKSKKKPVADEAEVNKKDSESKEKAPAFKDFMKALKKK